MLLKRILIATALVLFLLVGMLAGHIYLVTKDRPSGPNWTMSQIDFNTAIDSLKSEKIKRELLQLSGVRDTRVNSISNYIIVLYDRKQHGPHDLVKKVNDDYALQSTLFEPSEEELTASCPAIDKRSLTYKVGSYFEKLFTN